MASAYGAAGSLVVILLWVYYSALIVFLGAEFTQSTPAVKGRRSTKEESLGSSGGKLLKKITRPNPALDLIGGPKLGDPSDVR